MRPAFTRRSGSSSVHNSDSIRRSDAVIAEYTKQKIRKELSRWSRKVLMCLGLENIGKHIVGESKWEKIYDNGCTRKCSTPPEQDEGVALGTGVEQSTTAEHIVKEVKEDAEELEEQEPQSLEEEQAEQEVEQSTPEDLAPSSPTPSTKQQEHQPEVEITLAMTGSNDSSNNSSAANSTTREVMKEEDDEQNTSRSGSTPSQEEEEEEADAPSSPTESDAVDGEEGTGSAPPGGGGGGALANNLFQILPYWYFLNRAFSMSSAERDGSSGYEDAPTGEPINGDGGKEEEDEDEDEEMASAEPVTPPIHPMANHHEEEESPIHRSRSPETTQRINSLILLESLQQRLRTQGEQSASGDMSALNHGLYLSQLLSRMAGREEEAGGGGGVGRNGSFPSAMNRSELFESGQAESMSEDQPLDLRRSSLKERSEEEIADVRRRGGGGGGGREDHPQRLCPVDSYAGHTSSLQFPYMLDEHTSKVFRSNPRSSKGYTAQELQAALHDIQSGKLGTRRAAVIYGIPRSTLRNKVYKLGKDRGRTLQMGGAHPQDLLHLNNNNNNNNNNTNNNNTLRTKESALRKELLGKLSNLRPLGGSEAFHQGEPDIGSYGSGPGSSSVFSPMNGDPEGATKLEVSPSLSHLIFKHAQAQKRSHLQQHPGVHGSRSVGMDSDDLRNSLGDHHVGGGNSSFLSGKDWKEALARHELLTQRHHHHSTTMVGPRATSQSHLGSDDASSSMDLAGKKSRPKRGKYRNYDREALVKAVRAVQNGEMSVHRAGSFFGVPHSTLEYKVKERHLLRRPKRKEMTSPLTSTKLSSVAESSSDSGMMGSTGPGVHSLNREEPFKPKLPAKSDRFMDGSSSGAGGGGHSHHLFPVTTDLRESLSRYLSSEQSSNKKPYTPEETDEQDGYDSEDGNRTEANSSPSPRERSLRMKEENGEVGVGGGSAAAASSSSLGGFIGNRLSDLFQLSDIFFRSGADSTSREALLDLSKK